MAKSMTGFGRGEAKDASKKITVEIRSVNHRYLDQTIKLPRKLNAFEMQIRNSVAERIRRGKVDVMVSLDESAEGNRQLQYHPKIAAMYVSCLKEAAKTLGLDDTLSAGDLSRLPDVFEMTELPEDEKALSALLEQSLDQALEQFVRSRKRASARRSFGKSRRIAGKGRRT